jgi:hypothetical protein
MRLTTPKRMWSVLNAMSVLLVLGAGVVVTERRYSRGPGATPSPRTAFSRYTAKIRLA